ncbi:MULTISPECIES: TetR/AcrR family transcriptional regulator [Streptomyces]|uniref:TetR/AcrR family transcriptional regulator n=1 Tax=Streptomyces TaxID=1883 RepID=UPI0006EB3765|nr:MULTISPECIES: TetR/AcrR family transcriptional regulator [Streptomyces]
MAETEATEPKAAKSEAASPRERYRVQVRAEIKEHAWEQIATAGASALSLNAIAKRMGMSGPALYRYYANRDALITELITDAYRSLADTFRAVGPTAPAAPTGSTTATAPTARPGPDLSALAHALRHWALDDPQRYLLIYGTPVPGYRAPDDVTAISDEIMATLLGACPAPPSDAPATPLEQHLAERLQWAVDAPASPAALHRALTFWTRLHGVLSLELAGHFSGMGFDPAQLFAAELEDLLDT